MKTTSFSRPGLRLERRLFHANALQTALAWSYALALYIAGLGAAVLLAAPSSAMGWLCPLPLLLAAYGLFLHGVLGHEGFHFNLSDNRMVSCTLGVCISSLLSGFCVTGYAVDHWCHHRQNNGSQDPDLLLFSRYRRLWTRVLLSRLVATARYARLTLRLAGGDLVLANAVPIEPAAMVRLARLNLCAQATGIALHLWAALYVPGVLAAWLACLGLVVVISGLNVYQEHAFAPPLQGATARSRSSGLCSLLYLGSNYHLEHHLYPGIPCWRLPAVHRRLQASGWYADKPGWVEPGFIGSFRFASRRYLYARRD